MKMSGKLWGRWGGRTRPAATLWQELPVQDRDDAMESRGDCPPIPKCESVTEWWMAALDGGDWLRERLANLLVANEFGEGAPVERLDALVPVLRIRNRSGNLVPLWPNSAQRLYARGRGRRNIILKARQVGMTTWIAARFFLETILRPGTVTLQVAHSLESAQQIFRIVHRFLETLPKGVRKHIELARANVRELAFKHNDSRYIVDTAGNRQAGRGLTVHNLHASEVALWPGDAQETMAALLGAVAPGGAVDLESTPRGMGGYFHAEWSRATVDEGAATGDVLVPHFFPWWVEPEYVREIGGAGLAEVNEEERRLMEREGLRPEQIQWRRWMRETFGEWAPQEYAESPAECFLVSGRPVFDVAAIEARLRCVQAPARITNNGAEWVWLEPVAGREYVIGADVAEGKEGRDFSSAEVVDLETGLQCAELLAQWPVERFARELAALGRRYNHALVSVERNNHGHAILYALAHEHGYPRIYRHPEAGGLAPGWPTNVQTKPLVMARLGRMLREAPEAIASSRLLEQCRGFVYGDNGEMCARGGMHDDLVMAMAIALAVRERVAGGGAVRLDHL